VSLCACVCVCVCVCVLQRACSRWGTERCAADTLAHLHTRACVCVAAQTDRQRRDPTRPPICTPNPSFPARHKERERERERESVQCGQYRGADGPSVPACQVRRGAWGRSGGRARSPCPKAQETRQGYRGAGTAATHTHRARVGERKRASVGRWVRALQVVWAREGRQRGPCPTVKQRKSVCLCVCLCVCVWLHWSGRHSLLSAVRVGVSAMPPPPPLHTHPFPLEPHSQRVDAAASAVWER
jgi:hypothetical protein